MKVLVVSDLHSNAEALRAVLARVRRKKFDRIVCLGDFVGYGAQPNQVLDSMRTIKWRKLYIRGNHDRVVAGLEEGEDFNEAARIAALWTREHLSAPNRRFLEKLSLGPLERDGMLLCHGSPHDEDEYVFNAWNARRIFAETKTPIILYGHTHLPVIFSTDADGNLTGGNVRGEATFRLERGRRYLINPGSVGQPRDRNPRASFAIVDTGRMTANFLRVAYDTKKTQSAIVKAGLPRILAARLSYGT